jgi:hypothetical protein
VIGEQPNDRGGERRRISGRHEEPGSAVLDHLGDATDGGGDDRARERHGLEDRQALRLSIGGQDGDVERGGDGRDVVAATGERDGGRDAQRARLGLEWLALRALANDQQVGTRNGGEDGRPGVEQGRVALLGLEPGDDADDRRIDRDRVFAVEGAADVGVGVAAQVDAVVDEADRGARSAFLLELADDRARDGDQVVHPRRQGPEQRAILLGPDATRMHGPDDIRAALSGRGQRPGRLRADHLGAVHVVVDDVGLDGCEMRGDDLDRGGVVHVVEDARRDAGALEPADGGAVAEREHRHVVARGVDAGHEVEDVLLGAAAGAGREQLDDADATAARRQREAENGLEARVAGERRGHAAESLCGA